MQQNAPFCVLLKKHFSGRAKPPPTDPHLPLLVTRGLACMEVFLSPQKVCICRNLNMLHFVQANKIITMDVKILFQNEISSEDKFLQP